MVIKLASRYDRFNEMGKIKNSLTVGISAAVVSATAIGIFYALRSDLYTVREIEVRGSIEPPPLSSQAVLSLAAVPVGKISLFRLDLKAIEKRLIASEWVDRVQVLVRPKDTLSIYIYYRQPRAMIQTKRGGLALVDVSGKVYGAASQMSSPDLPILGGFSEQAPEKIQQALKFLATWEASTLGALSLISSIDWDEERGFRTLVSYPIKNTNKNIGSDLPFFGRTMVDFGSDISTDLELRLSYLANVFQYLGQEGVSARQIWADAGKKIVVKTSRGS